MLSIRVTSLPTHGQTFDHAEVSTQYDFIFECDRAFQFVKEDFPLGDILEGVSSGITSSYFFVQVNSRSMLHHVSVGASLKQNKSNLILTLTLNILLPSIVFHNKICVFIIIFTDYSRLICYVRRQRQLGYVIGSVYICVKFVFLCLHNNGYCTACLIRVFKFYFKVFRFLAKYCYSSFGAIERWKKAGPIQYFFQKITSSSMLCIFWISIISNFELRKVCKIVFLLLLLLKTSNI